MNLQSLIDERAIVHGLRRFAEIADRRQWSTIAEVFAEDVRFNYDGERKGLNELRAVMKHYLERCGSSQHLLGSIAVDVDGDSAISRAYVHARHQAPDRNPERFLDTSGEYIDHWVRLSEGWRITRRQASFDCIVGDRSILWDE